MQEKPNSPQNDRYDLTVYSYALEKLGDKEQARRVLHYVKDHIAELNAKYPPEGEDYQLYLCMFTNEVIKRLTVNWAAEAADSVARRWGGQPPAAETPPVETRRSALVEAPPAWQPKPALKPIAKTPPEPEPEPVKPRPAPEKAKTSPAPARKKLKKDPPRQRDPRDAKEGFTFFQLLAVLLCAILMVWMLVGLLMALEVIPSYDLGYTWFNQHLLPVF